MNSALKHLRVQLHSLHLSKEQHEEVLAMIEEAYDIGSEHGWDSRDETEYFVSSTPY